MIRLARIVKEPLTRGLVERLGKLPGLPGERGFKPQRCAYLERKVRDGLFLRLYLAIVVVIEDGGEYRLNGQHSLSMLSGLSAEDFPAGIPVVVECYEVHTDRDAALLWEQIDPRRSARTAPDILGPHKATVENLRDKEIPPHILYAVVAGVAYALREGKGMRRLALEERAHLLHEHAAFVLWARAFVAQPELRRVGIVAAMFRTWSKDEAAATVFWTYVRDHNHANPKHASHTLAKLLYGREKPGTRELFHTCHHEWRAFREGRATGRRSGYFRNAKNTPRVA